MNHANVIVDTSVIIKWLLPDEEDVTAMQIKRAFTAKTLTIFVPHLMYYEVGNVLKIAVKRERISKETAKNLYNAFVDLEFVTYATRELFTNALSQAIKLDISVYDASYIALSEYLQIPFLTADQKLLNKAQSTLVLDLKDY